MSEPPRDGGTRCSDLTGLVEACAWLADAHLAEDPEQTVAALCEIYQRFAAHGWVPSERAAVLLRVHETAVDAALSQLVAFSEHPVTATAKTDVTRATNERGAV